MAQDPNTRPPCDEHRPVQHRDRKPPWCRMCGYGEDGRRWRDLNADGTQRKRYLGGWLD